MPQSFSAVLLSVLLLGAAYTQDTHGDHGEHEHSEVETSGGLNAVAAGDYLLYIEPLLDESGNAKLGLKLDMPAPDVLELSVTSPSGETTALTFSEIATDDAAIYAVADLPVFEEGIWRVTGTVGDSSVSFPLAVYGKSAESLGVYLILAPAPSLSSRGLTEAFIYAFREGEAVHGSLSVSRRMVGMQHATDDEVLILGHDHFGEVYNMDGFSPMANRAPLSFAMAGPWLLEVTDADGIESVTFEIDVLDE